MWTRLSLVVPITLAIAGCATTAAGATHTPPSAVASATPDRPRPDASTPAPLPTPAPTYTAPVATLSDVPRCPASDYRTTLTLDRTTYRAGQSVVATATVTNASTHNCAVLLGDSLSIRYPDGSVVLVFGAHGTAPSSAFTPPGNTNTNSSSWDSTSAAPGSYTALWNWGGTGAYEVKAERGFTIVAK